MADLMQGVFIHHLRFEVQARDMASLGLQPGSALRGALYGALSRQFCPDLQAVHLPGHKSACPVCRLLAAEDPENARGRDLPRPITIEPPPGGCEFRTGDRWHFGVSLIGQTALDAFPHLIRAVQSMGQTGVNHGRFDVTGIDACHPLSGERQPLLNGKTVKHPTLPITAEQIDVGAGDLPADRVMLEFLTPLRIAEAGHLCHRPDLGVMLRRLLERCQAIASQFGSQEAGADRESWREASLRLSEIAEGARLIRDETRWLDAKSGSRRTGQITPIGGLVGTAVWEGELAPALPWLLWGQSLHVGKNAVKGNGWYRLVKE